MKVIGKDGFKNVDGSTVQIVFKGYQETIWTLMLGIYNPIPKKEIQNVGV